MTKTDLNRIFAYLDGLFPNAGCELIYTKDYELLIGVVLSAQTTDQSVNRVTPVLFKRYPSLQSLAQAPLREVQSIIRSIGLFRTKAKHIVAIAKALLAVHGGKVPSDKGQLTALPGVGNKTANVVRAELFKIPEIAVDTHVFRIAKRLAFARAGDDVSTVERKLRRALPIERYIKTHHQLIHFGRYQCLARQPHCKNCHLIDLCKEKQKNLKV